MDNGYINLVPGNWFELKNISADKVKPYNLASLKEEILNQVNHRAEKLDFIYSVYGNIYPLAKLENITFYLDNNKFNQIAKILSGEKRHPIITFHGTKPESVESILENGYLIPGINNNIKIAHGSRYGLGIYSSPFFEITNSYAKRDKDGYIYVFINLLFLGKAKMVCDPHLECKGNPINGCYPDGTHTRIVYGLNQIISADPSRIVPVAIIKINTNG